MTAVSYVHTVIDRLLKPAPLNIHFYTFCSCTASNVVYNGDGDRFTTRNSFNNGSLISWRGKRKQLLISKKCCWQILSVVTSSLIKFP